MFTARVRASFLYSLSGENGFVAAKAKLGLLNSAVCGREVSPSTSKGIKIRNLALHTSAEELFSESDEPGKKGAEKQDQTSGSSSENDDWSELGAVAKVRFEMPKLFTEKPELFRKSNGNKKTPSNLSLRAENGFGKSSSVSTVKNHRLKTQVSNFEYDETKAPDSKDLTSVNVPSSVTHSNEIPASGKVSNASISKNPDGSSCCNIKNKEPMRVFLKNAESRGKVAEMGHKKTKKAKLRNQSTELVTVVGFRIRNLNPETVDSAIHRTCSSYGRLQGLARIDEDVVDALFQVKNASKADLLLEKLNDTAMDEFQWSAELQSPISAPPSVSIKNPDAEDQLGLRLTDCMDGLRRQMDMYKVLAEDLETLLHSILHLDNHPLTKKD